MYVVFARRYRPQRFEDVVGQQHVTTTLQNALRTGRVAHAYLFCGSRGIGKTSVARILAKALNCADGPTPDPCCTCDSCRRISTGDDIDVLEIDGASNRGIDEVRELRQNARLSPAHSRFKIYYIDEVHMLTGEAFNALLKTLEEPPEHVKFIFSTTDPQRLPDTVQSRCQRFDFHRIADADIVAWLESICAQEGIQVEAGGLAAIARAARGGMRDALSTLDQLASVGETVTLEQVLDVLGALSGEALGRIVDAVACEDVAGALGAAHDVLTAGTEVESFADQLSQYLRDLLVAAYCGTDAEAVTGALADPETLARQAASFAPDQLIYMIQLLREAKLRARRDTAGRIAVELALVKMARLADLADLTDAVARLADAPPASAAGAPAPAPRAGGTAPPSGRTASAPQGGDQGHERPVPNGGATVARMRAKLEARRRSNGRHRRGQANGNTPATDAEPEPEDEPAPDGIDPSRYRQILDKAEDRGAARAALRETPLLRAFAAADELLGLEPVAMEREEAAEPPDEAAAEQTDEQDD